MASTIFSHRAGEGDARDGTVASAVYPCLVNSISASGYSDVLAGSMYGYSQDSPTCLYSGDGVAARTAGIGAIGSLALGPDGSLYIAGFQFNCIHRVGTDGINRMFAGSCPGSWQFPGVLLNGPMGVAADAAGNVYIADTGNERVLKVTPHGVTTTIAGTMPAVPQQP
jgi:sugar lactone lactonase YvrE